MARGEKGFRDRHGNKLKRDSPVRTRTGIIIYKASGKKWNIYYPDDSYQYGGVTTIKLINLIYHLGQGKNLDEARELAGLI